MRSALVVFLRSNFATQPTPERIERIPMTFQEFLARPDVQRRNNPVGDFARDTMRDPVSFPERNTKQAWRKHLFYAGACEGAMSAFESALVSYKRSQRAFAREESCVEQ
jgi:hypothetical protein